MSDELVCVCERDGDGQPIVASGGGCRVHHVEAEAISAAVRAVGDQARVDAAGPVGDPVELEKSIKRILGEGGE